MTLCQFRKMYLLPILEKGPKFVRFQLLFQHTGLEMFWETWSEKFILLGLLVTLLGLPCWVYLLSGEKKECVVPAGWFAVNNLILNYLQRINVY